MCIISQMQNLIYLRFLVIQFCLLILTNIEKFELFMRIYGSDRPSLPSHIQPKYKRALGENNKTGGEKFRMSGDVSCRFRLNLKISGLNKEDHR